MFRKALKLHYTMAHSIFWFNMMFLLLSAIWFVQNSAGGFVIFLKVAPVLLELLLGANKLFASEDFEGEAVLMQMLPLKKSVYYSSKLVFMGIWSAFSLTVMTGAAFVSSALLVRVPYETDALHRLLLWLSASGMSQEAAWIAIGVAPVGIFLLTCLLCQGITVAQLIGNGFGSRLKKEGGVFFLTVMGAGLSTALIYGGAKCAKKLMTSMAFGNGAVVLVSAGIILIVVNIRLYLCLVKAMEYKYEV
ncbi:MAG: hypothetical protein U0M21_00025 [Emergencia sp.]|nr:hypothetical protein [Emergencia sp.]